jgi:lysophospholipase L1-like esterase
MKQYIVLFITLAALIAALLNGCTDSAPTGPVIGLGNSTVTKYVSVGNSLTAGYQSNGLYESAQIYSYPNLIAQQLRKAGANIGSFEQPIYSDPGTPDPVTGKASRYEIISLVGPIIGPKGLTAGSPTNSTLARPYDNLGIPGIPLAGFLDTTGTYQSSPLGPYAILRWKSNPLFPSSVFRQAAALHPDLVTFWLGANDVLGFATKGGFLPPTYAPTPVGTSTTASTFAYWIHQALDTLRKTLPSAKIVVGNIPDVSSVPFFTTVGPALKQKMAQLFALGGYLYFQKHVPSAGTLDSTQLSGTTDPLLTLAGMPYIGTTTGKWYIDNSAYPIFGGVDTSQILGTRKNPIPDPLVLDIIEQGQASSAISGFNSIIAHEAQAIGAALVDFNGFFNNVKANGLIAYGEEYTVDYILGDIFSLDGVHPSNRGYGIVANEYIKVINSSFGMNIPLVDLNTLPKLAAPLSKGGNGKIDPVLPFEAFNSLDLLFSPSVQ